MFKNNKRTLAVGAATIGATAVIGHGALEYLGVPHGQAEALVMGAETAITSGVLLAVGAKEKIKSLTAISRDKITSLLSWSK